MMQVTTNYRTNTEYDVIVCGGGPSGVAAAVSSARKGAKTLLIEQGGCLGGFWTQGLLTWLIDTEHQEGLLEEVKCRLEREADGLRVPEPPRFTADTEKTKIVLEALCAESGVSILYHTFISDVVVENSSIQYILTESKSGHVAYGAKIFVDTTGDGDIGYLAGAEYALGNDEGITQPVSLIGHFTGVSLEDLEPFDSRKGPGRKPAILNELAEAGVSPSYRAPLIAVLSEPRQTYAIMINHEYRHGLSAENLTESTIHGRQEIHAVIDALRRKGGIWKDIRLTATADLVGVREGRRIRGLYTVTADDVNAGRQFPDAICTVYFATDVHNLKPGSEKADRKKYGDRHEPYQIPLRCLISADLDNLLMGGRCISGDFVAHSSYRVAGPAFRTGEVAGLAAAHCAVTGCSTREIKHTDIL